MRTSGSLTEMVAPLLKWAGGKRWLTSTEKLPVPSSFDRYVEPFVGSGAVFFHLRPANAVLSDLNEDLISLYQVARDSPAELAIWMSFHQSMHGREHYYAVRAAKPADKIERAARFLYLNRTCWNGLYRVNRRGEFNVPIGTKQAVLLGSDDFEAVAELLKGSTLVCADFEAIVDTTGVGDFVFVDPPYTVQHNFNGFLKYNESIFSWNDQVRLRDALVRAKNRGAAVCVTNADHQSVRELYEGTFTFERLERNSVLAGAGGRRGATSEALMTANI